MAIRKPVHDAKGLIDTVRSKFRTLSTIFCCAACALSGWPALAQTAPPSESQVQAAFLYNFAKYVEWPAEIFPTRDAPITFCVVGNDHFGAALTAIDGRKAQGRTIRVRRGVAPDELGACQVAFVADSEERRISAILAGTAAQPVLTVSDIEGFAEAGGAIGFVRADQRVQFEVNAQTLQRSHLRLSSEVLKLARTVIGLSWR